MYYADDLRLVGEGGDLVRADVFLTRLLREEVLFELERLLTHCQFIISLLELDEGKESVMAQSL